MSLDGKTTFIELVYLGTFRTFRNVHYYKQSMILWLPRRRGRARGLDRESGAGRCKLLHVKQINSKVLMYSTGNYIQYPVINHHGKEYEKRTSQCV